ncbi:hypothetical protein ACOMHN_013557 [Nucella lapillus]
MGAATTVYFAIVHVLLTASLCSAGLCCVVFALSVPLTYQCPDSFLLCCDGFSDDFSLYSSNWQQSPSAVALGE